MSALRQTHLLIVIGLFASLQAVAQQPSSTVPPTVSNLVGKWTGTLTQPNSTYTFSLDVQQDGQGVKGTSRIENASNPAYAGFGVMQFSGTISQGKFHFAETAISQEQHVGSNTRWCLKKGDLTLNGDGSLSGSWNDPGCNAGSVSLKKVAATDCSNPNTSSAAKVLLDNYIEGYKAELKRNAQSLANGAQSVLDGLQEFISHQSQQQNQWCGDGTILESSNASSDGASATAAKEKTPTTNPEDFEPVRGRDAKRNTTTGEIWVKDKLHKDEYEVYKNLKQFENGNRTRVVWDDGRVQP